MSQDDIGEAGLLSEACEWLERIESGKEEDLIAFDAWLCADKGHVNQVLKLQALICETRRAIRQDAERIRRAKHTRQVIAFPASHAVSHAAGRRSPWRLRAWALAACILVAIGAAFFATADENTFETSAGQTLSMSLADGSTARLNSGSRIHVRFRSRTRDIDLLQGEAMFEVAHDASRPFRVHAHGITAQALGTRFDVKETGDTLSVLVVSGRVAVFNSASRDPAARPLDLTARQRVLVSLKTGEFTRSTLLPRELRTALAWVEGTLQMHGTTLRETVEEFNAANSAKQFVIDDPTLNDVRFGGALDVHNPEGLVKTLSAYGLGVSARASGGTIEWHITGHPNSGSADPQTDPSHSTP